MTTRATTTTSNNSVGATSNIQLASPQEEGSELVVLVGRRRHRRDVGSALAFDMLRCGDRKSVVWGKSVSVRVDLGGRRIIKKKKHHTSTQYDEIHKSENTYDNS